MSTDIISRLSLPLIAAPMTGVSGPDLMVAACRNGVIGSFPTHNAASAAELDGWLDRIHLELAPYGSAAAPVAPNLVVHPSNARLDSDVDRVLAHGIELVITSVGSPAPVIDRLHDAGCHVWIRLEVHNPLRDLRRKSIRHRVQIPIKKVFGGGHFIYSIMRADSVLDGNHRRPLLAGARRWQDNRVRSSN